MRHTLGGFQQLRYLGSDRGKDLEHVGVPLVRYVQIPQFVQFQQHRYHVAAAAYLQVVHGQRLQSVLALAQRGNVVDSGARYVEALKQRQILDDYFQTVPVEFRARHVQDLQGSEFAQCHYDAVSVKKIHDVLMLREINTDTGTILAI